MEWPDVYQFDDFRIYLQQCYNAYKANNKGFSARKFASAAGFTNPGYFNDVIKSKRKLSKNSLSKITKFFKIEGAEEDFLQLLVIYGQSKKAAEREEAYAQILFRRSRSKFQRLNPSLVRYYEDYRYPLVRSAIEVKDFRGDYEALALFLSPPLPTTLVKKIVRDLCEWKLVEQHSDGRYTVSSRFVEPPPTMNQLVRRLNKIWLEQASDSIQRFSPSERHVSSLLLGISNQTRDAIRKKIEDFQKEIFELIQQDTQPQTLMQLSLAFFPRSRSEETQ